MCSPSIGICRHLASAGRRSFMHTHVPAVRVAKFGRQALSDQLPPRPAVKLGLQEGRCSDFRLQPGLWPRVLETPSISHSLSQLFGPYLNLRLLMRIDSIHSSFPQSTSFCQSMRLPVSIRPISVRLTYAPSLVVFQISGLCLSCCLSPRSPPTYGLMCTFHVGGIVILTNPLWALSWVAWRERGW